MGTVESFVRPLNAKERRLMASAVAWRKGRLHKTPRRMLVFVCLMSAVFWLWMMLPHIHDRAGQGGYKPLFIALGIVFPLSLWAFVRARSELKADVLRYERALTRNEARVVRIRADQMIDFEEAEDEGACYAFQLDGHRIVFVSGQDYYASARFPNRDFSLIDVCGDGGIVVESFIEKHGAKLMPLRRISAKEKSRMRTPNHLEVIPGDLESLEHSLAISSAEKQPTNGTLHA